MEIRIRGAACAVLLCVGAWLPADAGAQTIPLRDAVAEVDERMDVAYHEVLARHDAAIAAAPGDAAPVVARCDFIGAFTDHDTGRYVVGAPQAFSACLDTLAPMADDAPLARVYLFEQGRYDDDADAAEALLEASQAWPDELRQRVAAEFAWDLDGIDDARAGSLAVTAVQLGHAGLAGRAVRHLADAGEHGTALALLEDAEPPASDYAAQSRLEAALVLQAPGAALAEVRRQEAAGREVDALLAAKAHLKAGDINGARGRLDAPGAAADADGTIGFEIAMAAREWPAAAATIDLVRTQGFVDHLTRLATLAKAWPSALLMPALWPSLAVLLVVTLGFALLPAVVLLPVHYRGALRRLAGRARPPVFGPVGLRHAWMAMSVLLVVPLVVVGLLQPSALPAMLTEGLQPDGQTLVRVGLVGALACIAVLAWPVWRFSASGGFGWYRVHRAWWRVLLAWAGVLVVGWLIAAYHQSQGADTTTDQIRMVADAVNSGRTGWEVALAFVSIAVLGPLWEEIAFRGLLLGGMARHISFGWANVLQAALFAAVHDDAPRFAWYFTLGLLTGWLVRSTRSLAPAVVLHMLVNALAFVTISQ